MTQRQHDDREESDGRDPSERLDRLAEAMAVVLAHRAGASAASATPADLLAAHPHLQDLLEPMLDSTAHDSAEIEAEAVAASPGESLRPSALLGDYRVIREVGRGGMGTVYEVEQISLRRRVALKLLHEHLSVTPRAIERFRREAAVASSLQHRSIVPIHEVGEWRGRHFFTMDLVDGQPLDVAMATRVSAREPDAAAFSRVAERIGAIADALEHAHAHGLVHRDIKPHNLMVAPDGTVRLLDFGLVKERDTGDSVSREFVGTPHYSSPEQITGGLADARSDIFSLGTVLYELLSGTRPFDGATSHAILRSIERGDFESIHRAAPRAPADLRTICAKAMAHRPEDRYQSARALADDLRRFLRIEPILARPGGSLARAGKWIRRNRLKAALIATATLLILGAPTLYAVQEHRTRMLVEQERHHLEEAERIAFRGIEQTLRLLVDAAPQRHRTGVASRELIDDVVGLCEDFLEARANDSRRRQRVANAMRVLSEVYLEFGDPPRALATCRRGLFHLGSGPATPRVADSQALVRGRLLRQELRILQLVDPTGSSKKIEASIAYWRRLVATPEPSDQLLTDFANTLELRARAMIDQEGDPDHAARLCDEALAVLPTALRERSPRAATIGLRLELCRALARLNAGDTRVARAELEAIEHRLIDRPTSLPLATDRILAAVGIAEAHRVLRDHATATAKLQAAVETAKELVREYPGSMSVRQTALRARVRLAQIWTATGRPAAAEQLLRDAGVGRPAVLDAAPARHRELRANAETLLASAILVRSGGTDHESAATLLRGATAAFSRLVHEQPDRPTLRRHLGAAQNNLAAISNEIGDHTEANELANAAAIALRHVLEQRPRDRQAETYLGMAESQRATALAHLGDSEGAVAAAGQALAHGGDNAGALRIAATAAAVAAQASARPDHQRIAVTVLERLAALSPRDARICLTDARFETLREHPDFTALANRVRR
ncbi:MAG: protein kinase [bacterium]|nr:protein kinase [bacterium]